MKSTLQRRSCQATPRRIEYGEHVNMQVHYDNMAWALTIRDRAMQFSGIMTHSTVVTTGGHAGDVASFYTEYRWLDHEPLTVYATLDSRLQTQFYASEPIVEDLVERDQDVPPSRVP